LLTPQLPPADILVSIDGDATYNTLRRTGASSTSPDVLGVVDFRNRGLRIVSTNGVGFSRVFGLGSTASVA